MGTKSKWINGILRFYNNAVVDENVVVTTAAGTLTGYGLSVISSTVAGTYTMAPPIKGVIKDIHVGYNGAKGSTFAATVRFSSVANQVTGSGPATTEVINGVVLTPLSTYPAVISLRGVSTVVWAITAAGGVGTPLMGNAVVTTTACT